MDTGVTVDTQAESVFRHLVEDTLAEFDNVFLKRLVAGWVIEHFSDDSGIAGTENIVFGNPHQIANAKTSHKRIV